MYVPGNHDEHFRTYDGMVFGNLEIRNSFVHETADGKRLLLLHGDEFDAVIRCSPLIGVIGDIAYGNLLRLNHLVHPVRKRSGMPDFSVAAHLKHRVKNAVNMISRWIQIRRGSCQSYRGRGRLRVSQQDRYLRSGPSRGDGMRCTHGSNPIPGPVDVIQNGVAVILDDDLCAAALGALDLDGADSRRYAESRTWSASTAQFLGHLAVNAAFAGEDPFRKTASP